MLQPQITEAKLAVSTPVDKINAWFL